MRNKSGLINVATIIFRVLMNPFEALKRIIQQDVYNFLRLTEFIY